MRTKDSLPSLPPHEMKQHLKEFEAVDQQMASTHTEAAPDLMEQLVPASESQDIATDSSDASTAETTNTNVVRSLRSAKEAAERERDDYRNQLLQLKNQFQTQKSPAPKKTKAPMDPEALVEGEHYNQLEQEVESTRAESQRQNQEIKNMILEMQLKAKYQDFDSVVSKANMEELRRSQPNVARSIAIAAAQDPFSAAEAAYSIIRDMGIDKAAQEMNMTRRQLQENATKPRSSQAASPQRGSSPIHKANEYMYDGKMTDELQTQLLKEMQEARKNSR